MFDHKKKKDHSRRGYYNKLKKNRQLLDKIVPHDPVDFAALAFQELVQHQQLHEQKAVQHILGL